MDDKLYILITCETVRSDGGPAGRGKRGPDGEGGWAADWSGGVGKTSQNIEIVCYIMR